MIDTTKTDMHPCYDCEKSTHQLSEYYMVWDHIWRVAPDPEGMLCIGCLEERLGRKLNSLDFPPIRVNEDSWHDQSDRLRNRLNTDPTVAGGTILDGRVV